MKINEQAKSFDYRQLRCPLSLVQAKMELKKGRKGDCFLFLINDKTFYTDLKKLQQTHQFSLQLQQEQTEGWVVEVLLDKDYPFQSSSVVRKFYD